MDLVPPEQWQHVPRETNPADSGSELFSFNLWRDGPSWLLHLPSDWPATPALVETPEPCEEKALAGTTSSVVSLAAKTDLRLLN